MKNFSLYDKNGFIAYKDLKDYKWKATEFSDNGDKRIFHETSEKVYACIMENMNKYYELSQCIASLASALGAKIKFI